MTRLSIELPDEVTRKLSERAAELGQSNIEQYVQMVLTAEAEARDLTAPQEVGFENDDDLLLKLKAGASSGAPIEITDADWDNKRRALISRHSKSSEK